MVTTLETIKQISLTDKEREEFNYHSNEIQEGIKRGTKSGYSRYLSCS